MSGVDGITPQSLALQDALQDQRLHGGGHGGHGGRARQVSQTPEAQAAEHASRPRAATAATFLEELQKEEASEDENSKEDGSGKQSSGDSQNPAERWVGQAENEVETEEDLDGLAAAVSAEWQAMNPTVPG
ncbi:MAG TPA: hypothetical protein VKU60_01005 [Chloroflexota bacterium]|nr:hypothetical protein [Chloroflexota bacterium]